MEVISENLENYKLTNISPTVYYIPNFITENEENNIMTRIYDVPKPKWTQLLNRRLQNWGGIPHQKGMIAEPIPDWLRIHMDKISKLNVMNGNAPNHVLVNEYLPGQGIMGHTDGPLFYPTITTISCGSHAVINFTENLQDQEDTAREPQRYTILLERRSLFIVQDDMYKKHLHSIDDVKEDVVDDNLVNFNRLSQVYQNGQNLERQTRISLTIRHVPKTTKIKICI